MRSPGFFAPRRAAARRAPPGPLGMKKERRSPRRPFPVKICENSRPPSRRPCPLSLDIPGFSHVLPSCPALSRLSQLSCLFTIVSMFALMVIIIFVQVIMRKAGNSLSWSEELGKFLFVWISWMGISLGQREGEHIKITMLTDRLPFRLAQIVNIISDIVVIIICAVIFYYGVELVVAQGNVPYAGIKISTSWGYLAVVLGCGLMILRTLVSIKRSALTLINGKLPADTKAREGGD